MAALRRAGPIERLGGQAVALEDHGTLEVIGEGARRRQTAHAGAHDDHLPADVSGHPVPQTVAAELRPCAIQGLILLGSRVVSRAGTLVPRVPGGQSCTCPYTQTREAGPRPSARESSPYWHRVSGRPGPLGWIGAADRFLSANMPPVTHSDRPDYHRSVSIATPWEARTG